MSIRDCYRCVSGFDSPCSGAAEAVALRFAVLREDPGAMEAVIARAPCVTCLLLNAACGSVIDDRRARPDYNDLAVSRQRKTDLLAAHYEDWIQYAAESKAKLRQAFADAVERHRVLNDAEVAEFAGELDGWDGELP